MASLVLLAGVGYAYYNKQKEWKEELVARIAEEQLDFVNTLPIKLLPLESSNIAMLNHPISRITFFKKDNLDQTRIQEQVIAILGENRWLAGFVAQRPEDTEMMMWYDPTEDAKVAAERAFAYVEEPSSKLSRKSSYSEWLEATQEYRVSSSTDILNRKSKPLWKVTVMDCCDDDGGKALVVSMCHGCGDYHTFYKLYNMLLASTAPFQLNPFRHPDFQAQAAQLLGQEEIGYFKSTNPAIWEQSKENTEIEVLAFTVSKDWMEKQPHFHNHNDDKDEESSSKFVAATLISWFFNLVEPPIGFYANSLRDYLDIIDDNDAGNYQNPIPYTPQDYATPLLVQQSLRTGKRSSSEPLPKYFSSESGILTFGLGVNHLSVMSASSSCQAYELHVPLLYTADLKRMPSRLSTIVLFWAKPNVVGVYCACKKPIAEKIIQSGIIDETISVL
jgi:hypothetical protein